MQTPFWHSLTTFFHHPENSALQVHNVPISSAKKHLETYGTLFFHIFPAVFAPPKSQVTPWSIADLAVWFGILWDASDKHLFEIEEGAFAITSKNQNSKNLIRTSKIFKVWSHDFPILPSSILIPYFIWPFRWVPHDPSHKYVEQLRGVVQVVWRPMR